MAANMPANNTKICISQFTGEIQREISTQYW